MKLASFFLFLLVCLGFGAELNAQAYGQPGVIGWNSPLFRHNHKPSGTSITITNNTDDAASVNVSINGIQRGLIKKGGEVFYEYGYGEGGDVRIRLDACLSTTEKIIPNEIPFWMATDPYIAGLAITPEYLANHPNSKDFQKNVGRIIRKLTKDEPGGQLRANELQVWAAWIVASGFKPRVVTTCEDPILVSGGRKVNVQENYPCEFWYPQAARAIILEVQGRRATGYRAEGRGQLPQY